MEEKETLHPPKKKKLCGRKQARSNPQNLTPYQTFTKQGVEGMKEGKIIYVDGVKRNTTRN